MADSFKIEFQPAAASLAGGDVVAFVAEDLAPSPGVAEQLGSKVTELLARTAGIERFKGKPLSAMTIVAPAELPIDRLIVVGLGGEKERTKLDFAQLGGFVAGKLNGKTATVLLDLPGVPFGSDAAADFTLGMRLRAYSFERYKTKKKDDDKPTGQTRVALVVPDAAAAKRAGKSRDAVAAGIVIARDLVNEPPNILSPEEFASRAAALSKIGVDVEILDEKAMRKIGMRALLAVGQGSARESRVAIMRWNGGKSGEAPVAFIGKGVVFDSGGISIKPGAGMEDMKGDMAGAACVVGLMHALATRKAKVNAVGAIGIV
jgi:leucyl aminopeptidase